MIEEIYQQAKEVFKKGKTSFDLPSGCVFLDKDSILSEKINKGDARYPYSCDGLTLWAYSSGNIKIEESTFNIILPFSDGREPNLCFYVGEKMDNEFFPISVTGAGKFPFEKNIFRFTVFRPDAVYYFVESLGFYSCVKMSIDKQKTINFTLFVKSLSNKKIELYTSAYFDLMLSHSLVENIETKWYRTGKYDNNIFEVGVIEYINRNSCFNHAAILKRDYDEKTYNTTSRTDYFGGKCNKITSSSSLIKGSFEENKVVTTFSDTAIAGDIIPFSLESYESKEIKYSLVVNGGKTSEGYKPVCESETLPELLINGTWNGLSGKTLSYFLHNVHRQNEFCARAKNYAGPYIGVRDIFQQVESALIWIPGYCRKKIIEALGFIGVDGRAPRQYSYPASKSDIPFMDLREYVDQGCWIISTVYTYISVTGDFSILDEVCGYYKFDDNKVYLCEERDSVLSHLIRIVNFLSNNLDEETNCLHALYGDWNDALDGLGKTTDKNKAFGTGVSVMATLQFSQNLLEMKDLLAYKGQTDEAKICDKLYERVKSGLLENVIVHNLSGERKILHGWGDKKSYFVGSFNDNDGKNRYALTSNAFWVLSGALKWDETLKKDIIDAYKKLDSKYGLKTFEPFFASDNDKVGRITRLPKGTAENGAVYIHATLFAIRSLFCMGEDKMAWEQLYKILPLTHNSISTTPFVMPNSYLENHELGLDGESMSDWFTGSACVLLKTIYFDIFGIKVDLKGVTIEPTKFIPFDKLFVSISIRKTKFNLTLTKNNGNREFFVNGKKVNANSLRFEGEQLSGEYDIEVKI